VRPRTTNNTQNRCSRPNRVAVEPVVIYTIIGTRTCITSIVGSWVAGAVALVILAKSTPVMRDARRLNTKLLLVSNV